MRNNTDQARRKRDARRGVALFALFQGAFAVCLASLCFIPELPGWAAAVFAVLAFLCAILVLPALGALKERYKEIEGGELDEARQY